MRESPESIERNPVTHSVTHKRFVTCDRAKRAGGKMLSLLCWVWGIVIGLDRFWCRCDVVCTDPGGLIVTVGTDLFLPDEAGSEGCTELGMEAVLSEVLVTVLGAEI